MPLEDMIQAGKQQVNTPLMLTCVSLHRLHEKAIFFTRGLTLLTLITVPWIATNLPADMELIHVWVKLVFEDNEQKAA